VANNTIHLDHCRHFAVLSNMSDQEIIKVRYLD